MTTSGCDAATAEADFVERERTKFRVLGAGIGGVGSLASGGVCVRAFVTRLLTTWYSRCASPETTTGFDSSNSIGRLGWRSRASPTTSAAIPARSTRSSSSGSACTSASLEPSYVLRALGLNDELAHSSLRFSFGRLTTEADVDTAVAQLRTAVEKLRELSPLWDMYKDGVDLDSIEWAAH